MKCVCWGALLALVAGISAGTPLAAAAPFLMRYDPGYTFPEQEGWQRLTYDPHGLLRREVDGDYFTLDSSASSQIADSYSVGGPGIDTSTGEELRVTWRMQTLWTEADYLRSDVVVSLSRGQSRLSYAELYLGPTYVSEGYDDHGLPEHLYFFSPGMHDFELHTYDLCSYTLHVDGILAFAGELGRPGATERFGVYFGDTLIGASSLSQWDYIQVAVVPEPTGLAAAGAIVTFVGAVVRRRSNA